MPWKFIDKKDARREFVAARWRNAESMVVLCRRFGISRQCGYEWWRRAQAGAVTYADGSHRTSRAQAMAERWQRRVRRLRQRYCFAGPAQLRWHLQRAYPLGPWPAGRTIGRWLAQAGLTRQRRRHPKAGPRVERTVPVARVANDVWTVDFKGWFLTQDGRRVKALTVRDLATRYVLHVAHMESTTERAVTAAMQRLFARYGLPRAIRVDNGPPFGGYGPHGWSTLTVAWICLGIDVLYGRPGCPQDNAAHEQMHQVLHQQTAKPSAGSLRAQQRRFERWRRHYNHDRPHQALGMHRCPPHCINAATASPNPCAGPTRRPGCKSEPTLGGASAGEAAPASSVRPSAIGPLPCAPVAPESSGSTLARICSVNFTPPIPRPFVRSASASRPTLNLNPGQKGSYAPSLGPSPKFKLSPIRGHNCHLSEANLR